MKFILFLLLSVPAMLMAAPCTHQHDVFHDLEIDDDLLVLYLIGTADVDLINNRWQPALEKLENAMFVAKHRKPRLPEEEFLILFNQVICFDNLGLSGCCEQSVSRMLDLIEEQSDDGHYEITAPAPCTDYQENESIQFARRLARLAPSIHVQNFLEQMVNEMSYALQGDNEILGSNELTDFDMHRFKIRIRWSKIGAFFKKLDVWYRKLTFAYEKACEIAEFVEGLREE